MFSVNYPAILSHLGQLAYGFQPVRLTVENRYVLLVKATKEALLTARLNQEIKIYLIPDEETENGSLGFITAFFDDHDEPLALSSPLYFGDELLSDLISVFSQPSFDLYFFDELDRELLGVRAQLEDKERFSSVMLNAKFKKFRSDEVIKTLTSMEEWFGQRTNVDDSRAFVVKFEKNLYPDDFLFFDARPEAYNFHGAGNNPNITSLERDEPGSFQERDLVRMLRRVFPGDSIFLNPERTDSGTELADILCHTEEMLLVVQAKDSPNNEATLKRTINRKRSAIRSHIKKGAGQLRGALSYIKNRHELDISTSSGAHVLKVTDRLIVGLLIVREMFDDDYKLCSLPVLTVVKDTNVPCILLDYSALHIITLHLGSPDELLRGLLRMIDVALENDEYPKPRFIGPPSGS
ncbi:MAG TPA: hypothetical protein DIW64_15650 [Cellvibrio sp.]|nr:hypothetical protein [Cellvibrio sp.]